MTFKTIKAITIDNDNHSEWWVRRKDVLGLIDEGCGRKFNWAKCESRKCGTKTGSYLYLCPHCKELKKRIKRG